MALVELDTTDEEPIDPGAGEPRQPGPLERLLEAARVDDAERALDLLARALDSARFPNTDLAEAAERLAEVDGADPIWAWLAVTAAPPGHWDDDTIDATVVAFCEGTPDEARLSVSATAMGHLGRADDWEPLDHARWVVRLTLAPASDWNEPLIVELLRGIRGRSDSTRFMADVVRLLFELPPDHDAPQLLLEELEPAGWSGSELQRVIDAIGPTNLPLSLRRTLAAMAEQA